MSRLDKIFNIGIVCFSAGLILINLSGICFSEEVSVTTYYPAPQATYRILRLVPTSALAGSCDEIAEIGGLYYDSTQKKLLLCDGTAWKPLSGEDIYWTLDDSVTPNYLYTDPNWNVGIGIDTALAKIHLEGGGLLFSGNIGSTPVKTDGSQLGAGTRMMWIPAKGAFRAGGLNPNNPTYSAYWNDINIGNYSFAAGSNTSAKGLYSTALGDRAQATGEASFASGVRSEATGNYSAAFNFGFSRGTASFATGRNSGNGAGEASFTTGCFSGAAGKYSFASGLLSEAHGDESIVMGTCADIEPAQDRSVVISLQNLETPGAPPPVGCDYFCRPDQAGQFKVCGNLKVDTTPCSGFPPCAADPNTSFASISAVDIQAYAINCNSSKQFKIPHPDPNKPKGTFLKHSVVEAPTAGDNIYRWTIDVKNGEAIIQLPDYYKFLNKDDMVFITAKGHLGTAYGEVDSAQEKLLVRADADGKYNVLLIGTRKDKIATEAWEGPEVFVKAEKPTPNILEFFKSLLNRLF